MDLIHERRDSLHILWEILYMFDRNASRLSVRLYSLTRVWKAAVIQCVVSPALAFINNSKLAAMEKPAA